MLHVSPSPRASSRAPAGCSARGACCSPCAAPAAGAQDRDAPTLAAGRRPLASAADHLEAAAHYEQLARRGFMNWDAQTALLAAREYLRRRRAGRRRAPARPRRSRARDRRTSAACCSRWRPAGARRAATPRAALVQLRRPARAVRRTRPPTCWRCAARRRSPAGDALAACAPSRNARDCWRRRRGARRERSPAVRTAARCTRRRAVDAPAGVSERERGWLELPALVAARRRLARRRRRSRTGPRATPGIPAWLSCRAAATCAAPATWHARRRIQGHGAAAAADGPAAGGGPGRA